MVRSGLLDKKKVLFVGTYPPIECGIATFTRDLVSAYQRGSHNHLSSIVAVCDRMDLKKKFPQNVIYKIRRSCREDYRVLRHYLKTSGFSVLNVQHEFGIYGGQLGSNIFDLIEDCPIPVVITLHTLLVEPSPAVKRIMQRIVRASHRVVVMTESAQRILRTVYDIERLDKVHVIPHGAPQVKLDESRGAKEKLGLKGKRVISTFGLINKGKGIEYMIEAMPEVLRHTPNAVYLVIGETHPKVIREEGESYRRGLIDRIVRLGLSGKVIFDNRYLGINELLDYLKASDVYVTPYLNRQQIVSGTLAYAMSCGKAVVSTPYLHAQEVLGAGRGLFANFKDSASLSRTVSRILTDRQFRSRLERRAYNYTRRFLWSEVGLDYRLLHEEVIREAVIPKLVQAGSENPFLWSNLSRANKAINTFLRKGV